MKTRRSRSWFACIVSGVALAYAGIAQEVPVTLPVVAAPESDAPATPLQYRSGWLGDVIKLVRAGIEEDVLMMFVESAGTFNLDSDGIIYMRDLGVSNAVITAMLRHDLDLAAGTIQPSPGSAPSTPPSIASLRRFLQESGLSSGTSPASPQTPLKQVALAGPPMPPTSPSPLSQAERTTSIVMDSGSPDVFEQLAYSEPEPRDSGNIAAAAAVKVATLGATASVVPVREPYAVQLTNTIVVLRAYGREPNVIVIVR